jgi:hypothetical protein
MIGKIVEKVEIKRNCGAGKWLIAEYEFTEHSFVAMSFYRVWFRQEMPNRVLPPLQDAIQLSHSCFPQAPTLVQMWP